MFSALPFIPKTNQLLTEICNPKFRCLAPVQETGAMLLSVCYYPY